MLRRRIATLLLAFGMVTMTACTTTPRDYMGFYKADFTLLEETDSHGGFLGDGLYFLILDCSDNTEKAKELIADWAPLPLTENLSLIMYGGEKDGKTYGFYLAEEAHFPTLENGCYRFVDRHRDSQDRSSDTQLFDRYSFNFSLAMYDTDNDVMYYMAYDT